jgi:hypothetical protein
MSSRHSGPFIYAGAGKKQAPDADICVQACKKIACEIQWCLSKNNHNQTKCELYVNSWKDCCTRAKESLQTEKDAKETCTTNNGK